jgi:L-threonylcarbamoyladenylate synthase
MATIGKDINKAKQLLEAGQLVAIPTETVYGLAGNALSADAVASIFSAKNRPTFDPLIVHVPSLERASAFARTIPPQAADLARAFWPGPLTLLLEKNPIIPDLVTAGLSTVGLRCPDHALTQELLEALPFPLAAPSANPFGYISPTTPEHVQTQLGDRIPYILDGGPCTVGIESTIVAFENGKGVILRNGGLAVEDIESVIGNVSVQLHSSSNPKAPGQLESHYAPRTPLVTGDITELLKQHKNRRTAVLSFRDNFDVKDQIILSSSGDLHEAARNFFSALRKLDQSGAEIIVAEFVPENGLGRAINDRLRRASSE